MSPLEKKELMNALAAKMAGITWSYLASTADEPVDIAKHSYKVLGLATWGVPDTFYVRRTGNYWECRESNTLEVKRCFSSWLMYTTQPTRLDMSAEVAALCYAVVQAGEEDIGYSERTFFEQILNGYKEGMYKLYQDNLSTKRISILASLTLANNKVVQDMGLDITTIQDKKGK